MSDNSSSSPQLRPGAGGRLLRLSAAAIVALALVGCGTNQGGGGSTGPGASANQAPAVSPAAELSGDLTVWAMGNEGVKLSTLADALHEGEPGRQGQRDPGRLGPGGRQAPDRDRRRSDARRQPDGHRHDGPVRRDRRLRARAGELRPEPRSSRAPGTRTSSTAPSYGVPWYVETRLLYYRNDIAEKAGITAPPATWDDLKAMAKAMQDKGGAKWGISLGTKNWQEYFPFLWSDGGDVTDAPGQVHAQQPAGRRGPDLLPVVLQGRASRPNPSPRASTSRRRSWPAPTRCSSRARGTSA